MNLITFVTEIEELRKAAESKMYFSGSVPGFSQVGKFLSPRYLAEYLKYPRTEEDFQTYLDCTKEESLELIELFQEENAEVLKPYLQTYEFKAYLTQVKSTTELELLCPKELNFKDSLRQSYFQNLSHLKSDVYKSFLDNTFDKVKILRLADYYKSSIEALNDPTLTEAELERFDSLEDEVNSKFTATYVDLDGSSFPQCRTHWREVKVVTLTPENKKKVHHIKNSNPIASKSFASTAWEKSLEDKELRLSKLFDELKEAKEICLTVEVLPPDERFDNPNYYSRRY